MPCAISPRAPISGERPANTVESRRKTHPQAPLRAPGSRMGNTGWALPLPWRSPVALPHRQQLWAVSTPVSWQWGWHSGQWLQSVTLAVLRFEGSPA